MPSRNEAGTIAGVCQTVIAAVDPVSIIGCDHSDDDRTVKEFLRACGDRGTALTSPRRGKGAQVACALQQLTHFDGIVVITDSDLLNPTEEVYRSLCLAVRDGASLAFPQYQRYWYEGNLTNHLVRPLCAAMFGEDVPQPIAGEMAMRASLAMEVLRAYSALPDPVRNSADAYGIDALIACIGLLSGGVVSTSLGATKLHAPSFGHIRDVFLGEMPILFHMGPRRLFGYADELAFDLLWEEIDEDRWRAMDTALAKFAGTEHSRELADIAVQIHREMASDRVVPERDLEQLWRSYVVQVRTYLDQCRNGNDQQMPEAFLQDRALAMLDRCRPA